MLNEILEKYIEMVHNKVAAYHDYTAYSDRIRQSPASQCQRHGILALSKARRPEFEATIFILPLAGTLQNDKYTIQ